MEPVSGWLANEIRDSLIISREKADRTLAAAESRAQILSELAADCDKRLGEARLERLATLRAEIEMHQRHIDESYVRMIETMATAVARLAEIAREADFSIPGWDDGIITAFEVRLTETREMTFRLATLRSAEVERRRTP